MTVREKKRRRLEAKGWKFGTAQEFLRLSDEEAACIDLKARLATGLRKRRRQSSSRARSPVLSTTSGHAAFGSRWVAMSRES